MSRICECIKSELSLFDHIPVQTVVSKGRFNEIYPLHPVTSGPIEFYFKSSDSDMFDLNDTLLEIIAKITNDDGSDIPDAEKPSVSKYFMYSIIHDLSIHLNETKIEGGHFLYPYQAYFSKILESNSIYKQCQLEAVEPSGAVNKTFQCIGPLLSDFLQQGRYLLNECSIRIKINMHKPTFFVTNGQKVYKLNISRAILHVRRCDINPQVLHGHETGLLKGPATYPLQHTDTITQTLAAGVKSANLDNLFSGQSPKLLVVAMLNNDNFNGTNTTNPFDFKPFDLTCLTLYVNSDAITHRMDFPNKLCRRQYLSMFQNLEMLKGDESNGITYVEWLKHPLFVFNLCPDMAFDAEHGQVKSRPNLRLEFQFSKDLPNAINVVIMSITDGILTINKDRQVSLEY